MGAPGERLGQYRAAVTTDGLGEHEDFFERLSGEDRLGDSRFVARNFRLDELLADSRAASYSGQVLPADDFPSWEGKHARFFDEHMVCTAPPDGPPTALDIGDKEHCPDTFGPDAIPAAPLDLSLSLVRVVGLFRVAEAVGIDEASVRSGLEDPPLRDGIIARWTAKLPVEPVFATLWQDVNDLVPDKATPPDYWADDLRDRLGLSPYDPELWGPIQIMVLRYKVADLPTMGSVLSRPLTVPTELDSLFFPPFCPAPIGAGIGRVVDLGQTLSTPWPEVLHPTFRWRGDHVVQLGVIERPVPSISAARGRHLRLLQLASGRSDYGTSTDGDLL
jgi:hypothetical protein